MKNLSAFKRWYSLSETAEAINEILDESLNQDDVIELVQTGEIEAWYDARGLFAVPVSPACHLYDHPSPVLVVNGYATNQHHQKGFMDFIAVTGPVRVLTEYHRMVVIDRFDAIFIPVDEGQAQMVFLGGKLLYDAEDDGFLQLVKRKSNSPSGSLKSTDFTPDYLSFDKESVLIRSEDLQTAVDLALGRDKTNSLQEELAAAKKRIAELEETIQQRREGMENGSQKSANEQVGDGEQDKLLKQIGALALLLAEKSKSYQRADKPNASKIADAVLDIAERVPDANVNGLGNSSLRDSISKGIKLLNPC